MIPYYNLDKRICSMYADTLYNKEEYKLVSYVKIEGCSVCKISELAAMDDIYLSMKKEYPLMPVYVIDVEKDEVDDIYAELCRSRIKSPVFIDTCGVFIQANPRFPRLNQ